MSFSNRLSETLLRLGLKQYVFAKAIGVSAGNVSDWLKENGKKPSHDALIRISEVYGIDINWLLTGTGDMYINKVPAHAQSNNSSITIPVYADIAAGIGIEAEDLEPRESISIPKVLLSYPGPYYCFRVNGVSMEPELHTGDYAIISGWHYEEDYNGAMCAFRSVDGLLIKRLVYDTRGKKCFLVPANHTHPIITYDENSPDLQIIGRLVAIIRKYQ